MSKAQVSVAKLKGGVTKIKGGVAKASAKGEVPAKRARTAFIFFCSEKRPEVTARGLSFGEITKELASMWKVFLSFFFFFLAQPGTGDDTSECAGTNNVLT